MLLIASVTQDEIDVEQLHQQQIKKKEATLPDNGDGRVKVRYNSIMF